MEEQPRILLMCPDLPFPVRGGGQMRMASISRASAKVAKVHIACIAPQIPVATSSWAEDLGITLENFAPPRVTSLKLWHEHLMIVLTACNLLRRSSEVHLFETVFHQFTPDLVWLETPYLLRYAIPWKATTPIAVDYWGTSEGAERIFRYSRGLGKIRSWLRWRSARGGEVRYAPQVKNIFCVSYKDAHYFERIAPKSRIWPIPNAILNIDEQNDSPQERDSAMIFTGDLSYLPNIDAAIFFVKEILPRIRRSCPKAKFQLVGRDPKPEVLALAKYPGIEITGCVPDLSDAIASSTLYVLPMRLGSGIRSKLFEVFPLGKPIVSTSVGAEGLELRHEANCLIADSPQNFANSCIRLLNDKDERKRLGEAVRYLAVDTYSEETVNRLIFQALDEILTNSVLSE